MVSGRMDLTLFTIVSVSTEACRREEHGSVTTSYLLGNRESLNSSNVPSWISRHLDLPDVSLSVLGLLLAVVGAALGACELPGRFDLDASGRVGLDSEFVASLGFLL